MGVSKVDLDFYKSELSIRGFIEHEIKNWEEQITKDPNFVMANFGYNMAKALADKRAGLFSYGYKIPPTRLGMFTKEELTPTEVYIEQELIESETENKEPIGVKYDSDKPSPSLLPMKSLLEVVKVLDFGARKYQRSNWMKVPNAEERYLDAAWRHLIAFTDGEDNDQESGLSHLAHCMCCLLFLLWFRLNKK